MACAVAAWPLAAVGRGYISQSTMTTAASDGTGTQTATDNAQGFNWQHTRQVVHGVSSATTIYDFATTGGGTTGLEVKLESYTENLFYSLQRSTSADDHDFVVGHMGGTDQNVLTGNPSGMLAAYQSYMLTYWLEIEDLGGYSSAYGQGDVYLDLSPVPEPATAGMLLGAAMVRALRRRPL